MGTPDRRIRVEADTTGQRFTVHQDGRQVGHANTLPDLYKLLAELGVELADLELQ